jgi:sulfonate transport system permease protein
MNRLFTTKSLVGLRGWLIPVVLIALWEIMSRQGAAHAYAFASLAQVWQGLQEVTATGELQYSLLASLGRALLGLFIGGLAGFVIGSAMALSRNVNTAVGPLYHIVRQVPLMGLVPVFSLWTGNGDTSKLIVVCISAFYPLVLATYESLNQVEAKYREVGEVLKLGRRRIFLRILLPAALPNIFTGLAFSLSFAWLATIGAEILFNAGAGLGNMMMNAQATSRMDILVILVVLIALVGFGLNQLLLQAGKRLFRWRNVRP